MLVPVLMRTPAFLCAALLGAGLLAAGCDSGPGPEAPDARPPEVSAFDFSPRTVLLDALPPDQQAGDRVPVTLTISAEARDLDGDLAQVSYVVQAPFAGADPVAAGDLPPTGGNGFGATITVELDKSVVGNYTVLVYGVDEAGHLSNQVRGLLAFVATGAPPVIEAVDLPERVTRPAPGADPVRIPIVATVTDPDGPANIARVEMQVLPSGGGAPLLLCDDGGQGTCNQGFAGSGDETAGDGRYTITLQVEAANAPGTTTFQFQAFDRAGLSSEPVVRTITIE